MPRVARRFLPVLIALLAVPAAASANTLHVTTKADVVPGSLRATIVAAHPNDVIEVPAGIYKLTAGELVTNKNLTIEGAGAGKTIVDGQGASRVFDLTDATFTLRGLTITGGHDPAMGGGIYTTAAALTLDRVSVRGNAAGGNDVVANGGGIYSDAQSLTLTSSSVIGNHSGGGGPEGDATGGGIFVIGTSGGPRQLSLDHTNLSLNTAGGQGAAGSGAGIEMQSDMTHTGDWTLAVTDSTIAGNVAGGGGNGGGGTGAGIDAGVNSQNSTMMLRVDRTTISGNLAGGRSGGSGFGGGIFFGASGMNSTVTLNVTNTTIAGNLAAGFSASEGGGIGGGIVYSPPSGSLASTATLQNVTVAGNTAAAGTGPAGPSHAGGISGSVGFRNTIIAGNQASVGRNCTNNAAFSTHSLEDTDTCGLGPDSIKNKDPKLGPLRDNGGPTLTRALALDSPALDKANGAFCPSTDQRGVPRDSAHCDIGAFELTHSDLALQGSASPPKVAAGRRVTFSYKVTNNGPQNALAVNLAASLPAKLRFAGAKVAGGGCVGNRHITCSVGTLPAGASRTVKLTAVALHAGKVASPGSVTSGSGDVVPGNNSARPSALLLPAVQKLSVKPKSWRLGGKGTKIAFTLSDGAKVRFVFAVCTKQRKNGKGCAHFSKVVSLDRHGHAGKNKFRFNGDLPGGAVLSPGSYRVSASASDSKGNRSPAKTALFSLRG